ncbi:hypothetical protein [Melittangium boletus]|uniref:Uncharacterized protein n=1 Tax=Melittangium boletus DSM 14713 TaxID=1294270 RepID=A0A250IBJ7_9BACT|nr:hypothetical protein [Melittangium boletus]ATB29209.1 hypothetical protein MEBOL_002658 [Melittangium boletus DSM 14713]
MKRFVIVFDNEPADSAPWISGACAASKLHFVDNDAITEVMSKNKEAQKVLLGGGPPGENPKLAPFYKEALEKVAGDKPRVGVYSTSWLLYLGQADGCVLDFAGLEEQRTLGLAKGVTRKQADDYVATYSAKLQDKARKALPAERILVLPVKESVAKKAELAAAFIKKLG